MRNSIRKGLHLAVISLVCFAPVASAQNLTRERTAAVAAFLVIPVPEPSSPALLAIDLLSVGGLILLFRRHVNRRDRWPSKSDAAEKHRRPPVSWNEPQNVGRLT